MSLSYIFQKALRKVFNRPCVKNSIVEKTARVDVGSVVINTELGRYSYIGEHTSVLHARIGAFTSVSNYCAIGGGSHPIDWASTSPVFNTSSGIIKVKQGTTYFNPFSLVHIGNDVWIGSHCLIRCGVTIGDGAVVGMGSVVTHDVGPYEIWAGNPARMIRKRFPDETIEKLQQIQWWKLSDDELRKHADKIAYVDEFVAIIKQ